jgi:hypothetical protein
MVAGLECQERVTGWPVVRVWPVGIRELSSHQKEGIVMSPIEITLVVVAAVLVVVLIAGGWYLWRHQSLRRRFGPEYRRLAKQDGPLAADRELRGRERRHARLELHELDPETREQYRAAWTDIQTRFVDDPENTSGAADELVTRLIADRGYPTADYDEQVAQLSVEHSRTLDYYRSAHDIHLRHERGEASTEELRQALVHYRALFADLLGEDPVSPGAHDSTDATRR